MITFSSLRFSPWPVGDLALLGDCILGLQKQLRRGSRALSVSHEESVLVRDGCILFLSVNLLINLRCYLSDLLWGKWCVTSWKAHSFISWAGEVLAPLNCLSFAEQTSHSSTGQKDQPLHISCLWWQHCTIPDGIRVSCLFSLRWCFSYLLAHWNYMLPWASECISRYSPCRAVGACLEEGSMKSPTANTHSGVHMDTFLTYPSSLLPLVLYWR